MIGGLVQAADFQRVLAEPTRSRSAHFALHHVADRPLARPWPVSRPVVRELSTSTEPVCPRPVDDFGFGEVSGHWIGCVVPKRHAKRAVTRNMLKRQMRSAFGRHAGDLPAGQWLVRLRAPFNPKIFVSARSRALVEAARAELDGLMRAAAG